MIRSNYLYERLEKDLLYSKDAAFDSRVDEHAARCHPDTRKDLLRRIREWGQNPQDKCIFWLSGMAGTGKSTISRTIAELFDDNNQLGASFFFKRGEHERDNASRFFSTIILHLVRRVPELTRYVRSSIEAESDISEKSLHKQFEKLIVQPLKELMKMSIQMSTLIIVIDALDECEPEADVRIILHLLSQIRHLLSIPIRIFLTSRPELPIRLGFRKMSADAHQDMVLEDIPQDTIKHDIAIYLTIELATIKDEYNIRFLNSQLPPDWPGDEKIQALAIMAVPLFIFAATVCRFVGDHRQNPKKQLATVLEQAANQASNLDRTYLPVLQQLVDGYTDWEKESLARQFRKIIGSIIVLADPLATSSLASLLGIPKEDIDIILDGLHSVLSIPSDRDFPVRLLHLSFRDFLLDPRKSKFWFWIDGKKTHEMIANRCLELMSRPNGLRENMCGLKPPGKLRNEIDRKTLYDYLSSDIRYACQYWIHHLEQGGRCIHDDDEVHIFLQQHLLHWLEALSLMGKISEGIALIDTLQSLVAVNSSWLHAFTILT